MSCFGYAYTLTIKFCAELRSKVVVDTEWNNTRLFLFFYYYFWRKLTQTSVFTARNSLQLSCWDGSPEKPSPPPLHFYCCHLLFALHGFWLYPRGGGGRIQHWLLILKHKLHTWGHQRGGKKKKKLALRGFVYQICCQIMSAISCQVSFPLEAPQKNGFKHEHATV